MTHPRVAFTLVALMIRARAADAQTPSDLATANALFDEAKDLVAAGGLAEACSKFEASMAIAPRLGVQLNLADCYERVDRTASAWVAFGEAAALARRNGDPRESFARQRQEALVPRLSRLAISISGTAVAGLTVTRDGVRVEPRAYGVAVPVDRGVHVLEASAPGRVPWTTQMTASHEGELIRIEVPELVQRSEPVANPPPLVAPPAAEPAHRPISTATWASAGIGVAGIAVGAALGIAARSLWRQAQPGCDASNLCTDESYDLVRRSRRDGNLSTIAFAVGGAALTAGVVLYIRTPLRHPVRIAPALTHESAGAQLVGAF